MATFADFFTRPLVGFLASGDEVVNGDIANRDGQLVSKALVDEGFSIFKHILTPDHPEHLQADLHYLMQHCDIIIMFGGLGPTSDDHTRDVLSNVSNAPLVLNEENWAGIQRRLKSFDLPVDIANKKQAYFPEGADIFHNPHGTAAGFCVQADNTHIFSLPGPPKECMEMFYHFVLPACQALQQHDRKKIYKWRLFGVSESEAASKLDAVIEKYGIRTGFRLEVPYLEFKLFTDANKDYSAAIAEVETALAPYQLSHPYLKTDEHLLEILKHHPDLTLTIDDTVTGGLLSTTLLSPETHKQIEFKPWTSPINNSVCLKLTGLDSYWDNQPLAHPTQFTVTVTYGEHHFEKSYDYKLRGHRTLLYVVAIACYKVIQALPVSAKA